MQSSQTVDVPTPRTDAMEFPVFHRASFIQHARQLERELIATTAELERTKDQLRVARETYECVRHSASMGDMKAVLAILDALFPILFTQPESLADSPEGADPVKATTFPA